MFHSGAKMGGGGAAGPSAPAYNFINDSGTPSFNTTQNFASQNLGAAVDDRIITVICSVRNQGAAPSVTAAGFALTVRESITSGNVGAYLLSGQVPASAGETGTISITPDGDTFASWHRLAGYGTTGVPARTNSNSSAETVNTIDLTLTTNASSAQILGGGNRDIAERFSTANINRGTRVTNLLDDTDIELDHAAFEDFQGGTGSPFTYTMSTAGGDGLSDICVVGASWDVP